MVGLNRFGRRNRLALLVVGALAVAVLLTLAGKAVDARLGSRGVSALSAEMFGSESTSWEPQRPETHEEASDYARKMQQLAVNPRAVILRAHIFDPLRDDPVPAVAAFDVNAPALQSRRGGHYWVVQFEGLHRDKSNEKAMEKLGAEIVHKIPVHAYLVRATDTIQAEVARLPHVRWAGPYRPFYRLDPRLIQMASQGSSSLPLDEMGRMQLMVGLLPDEQVSEYLPQIQGMLGVVETEVLEIPEGLPQKGLVRLVVDGRHLPSLVYSLSKLGGVAVVEPYAGDVLHNDDAVPWHQTGTNLGSRDITHKLHANGLVGYLQTAAVADTGLENDMCYFRYDGTTDAVTYCRNRNDSQNPNYEIKDEDRCNKVVAHYQSSPLAVCYDSNSSIQHGTHVSGTIVGDSYRDDLGLECGEACLAVICEDDANGDPVLRLTGATPSEHHQSGDGIAPGARLVAQDYGDGGGVAVANPAASITQAWNSGARYQNNSWGEAAQGCVTNPDYDQRAQITDGQLFSMRTMNVIYSAGNDGGCGAESLSGAGSVALNTLSVGWAEGADLQDINANSSKGPTLDGRIKPDIVAQGNTFSAGSSNPRPAVEFGDPGDGNCNQLGGGGTSFSAPIITGLTALVGQYFRDGYYPSGAPTRGFWAVPGLRLEDQPENPDNNNDEPKCELDLSLCEPGTSFQPTNALVKAVLINSTVTLTGANSGNVNGTQDRRPNFGQGWGNPVLDDTLYFSGDPTRAAEGERSTLLVLTDTPNGVDGSVPLWDQREQVVQRFTSHFTGSFDEEIKFWEVTVLPGEPLVATVAWSHPQPLNLAFPLENDLDLEVIGPDPATCDPDDLFVWRSSPTEAYTGPAGERDGWVQTETMRDSGEGKTCHGAPGPPICSPPLPKTSWPIYASADHVNNVEQIALRSTDVCGGQYWIRLLNWKIDGSQIYNGYPNFERETPDQVDRISGGEQGFALIFAMG